MTEIYTYPVEWYQFTQLSFQLRAASQVSARTWAGGNSIYGPHAQMFLPKLTASPQDDDVWPAMDAFFSRLEGQAGLLRIGDPSRKMPQYNEALTASIAGFSDGSSFTDGSGFANGLLPPTCYVGSVASRGDRYVIVSGLPPETPLALQSGDLFEVRPNGIASVCPNLYQVVINGSTDSAGNVGVEIRPPLRMDLNEGDIVVLNNPTSVFHLVDDTQAEMTITAPALAAFGFSLIEAIENF